MTTEEYCLRPARRRDIAEIQAMQRASMRELGRGFYSPAQIAAALVHVPPTGAALIDEGHFFVIEEAAVGIVATGGWSLARPAYAALQARPAAAQAPGGGTVRQVFVHPARARRGLGAFLMRWIEADAAAAGLPGLALAATLSGAPLYRKLGYAETGDATVRLPDGQDFPLVGMHKTLVQAAPLAA